MKVKLNLFERISLLQILPQKGNYADQLILRNLRDSLSITEQDHKDYALKEGAQVDSKKAQETKEFEFQERATGIIEKCLKEKEEKNELTEHLVSPYEQFVLKHGTA